MLSIAERIGVKTGQKNAKAKFAELIFDALITGYQQMAAFVEQVEGTRGDLDVEQVSTVKDLFNLCNNLNHDLSMYSADYSGILDIVREMDEDIDKLGVRFHQRRTKKETAISTAEAMTLYSRSKSTIYRWIKSGKLQAEKQGRRWVIFV